MAGEIYYYHSGGIMCATCGSMMQDLPEECCYNATPLPSRIYVCSWHGLRPDSSPCPQYGRRVRVYPTMTFAQPLDAHDAHDAQEKPEA